METLQNLRIRHDCRKGSGGSGNPIAALARVREEEYFARENARLIRELREATSQADGRSISRHKCSCR